MLFSSKSTRCVRNSVCVSVRQRVSKPIAEHSMGVPFVIKRILRKKDSVRRN